MSDVFSGLRSIGIFFSRTSFDFRSEVVTPEDAIIRALPVLKSDYLTLQLIYTWIQKHHSLLHAEALSKKIEKWTSSNIELAFLNGLLYSSNDKRLISITKNHGSKKEDFSKFISKHLRLAAEIGQTSYDQNLAKFGIKMNRLEMEDEKKFIPQDTILKQNPFLYCRALFGSNWRADVAALIAIQPDVNPTKISSLLQCSYETAHRNYHALKLVSWPKLPVLEA